MSEQDPAATARRDQAEAEDREQTSWDLNVRASMAAADVQDAHAAWLRGRAEFWSALAGVFNVAIVLACLVFGWVVVAQIVSYFR